MTRRALSTIQLSWIDLRSWTPPGSEHTCAPYSGGIATLDHRLPSGEPSGFIRIGDSGDGDSGRDALPDQGHGNSLEVAARDASAPRRATGYFPPQNIQRSLYQSI